MKGGRERRSRDTDILEIPCLVAWFSTGMVSPGSAHLVIVGASMRGDELPIGPTAEPLWRNPLLREWGTI